MRLSQIFTENGVGTMIRRTTILGYEDFALVGKMPDNTYLLMDLDSSKLIEPVFDDEKDLNWTIIKPALKRYLWAHQVKQTFECIIMQSTKYMSESEAELHYKRTPPDGTKYWKLPYSEMTFDE